MKQKKQLLFVFITGFLLTMLTTNLLAQQWYTITTEDGLLDDNVWSCLEDDNHTMWFSGFDGITTYDMQSFQYYDVNDGLAVNFMYTMVKGDDGIIWLPSTGDSTITKYDGTSFTIDSLPGLFAECSYVDMDGNIWLGSYSGDGAAMYDGNEWTTYNNDIIQNGQVYSIADDDEGNIYFATENGVIKYDGAAYSQLTLPTNKLISNINQKTSYNRAHSLKRKYSELSGRSTIWELFKDSQGNLWIITNSEYFKYDGANFTTYTADDGLTLGCQDIAENSQGKIYFAGGNTIDVYDGSTWSTITNEDGLPVNADIWAITIDHNDYIWLGNYGEGVYYYGEEVNLNDLDFVTNVYPNPTTGIVNIQKKAGLVHSIEVYNINGQRVLTKKTGNKSYVELNNFLDGVYFIKIISSNDVTTYRIVKQ